MSLLQLIMQLIYLLLKSLTLNLTLVLHITHPENTREYATKVSMFFLNFSSAGKGPFTASKAKNMHHRGVRFRRQAGSGVWEMAPLLPGNLGAKFSEMSFPKYKTYFT